MVWIRDHIVVFMLFFLTSIDRTFLLCVLYVVSINLVVLCDIWFNLLYRKVEQVAEEVDSLKESLDKHLLRNQKRVLEARERTELLQRAVCKYLLFNLIVSAIMFIVYS